MKTLAPPTKRPAPAPPWRGALAEAIADHDLPPDGSPATEAAFLAQPGMPLAEWVDGKLDYLPLPTPLHQTVGSHLYDGMRDYFRDRGRKVTLRFTGIPVRIPAYGGNDRRGRFPDVALLLDPEDPRETLTGWDGCDLIVEIVSPDNPRRDTDDKRLDYAAAGVPEYWIVDPRPQVRTISVLSLNDGAYRDAAFAEGETAASVLLPGFTVDVAACLAAR